MNLRCLFGHHHETIYLFKGTAEQGGILTKVRTVNVLVYLKGCKHCGDMQCYITDGHCKQPMAAEYFIDRYDLETDGKLKEAVESFESKFKR